MPGGKLKYEKLNLSIFTEETFQNQMYISQKKGTVKLQFFQQCYGIEPFIVVLQNAWKYTEFDSFLFKTW